MKHKQTLRRGLSVLLSLVLCLSLLPAAALAEGTEPATATADFTDGDGTAALALLNDAKTGTADSTWADNTLTLKGVNFSTTAATAVILPAGAKIVLAEGTENTITSTIASAADYAYMSYGICTTNGLTIEGSGKLTVTGGAAQTKSHGIDAADVTISGGTVTATGGAVNAPGDEYTESCGIHASGDVTISDTAKVNAMGGDATADYSYSRGIYANGNVTIKGGSVTATGGTAGASCGIVAADVTISDGTVTAAGGEAGKSHGIYAYDLVTISGGTVTANGGAAYESCGIYANSAVTISGGSVTATGGTAGASCGIFADGNVAISGGTVTATGGTAETYSSYVDGLSYGIHANSAVAISGGTVTAAGGTAELDSFGIYAVGDVTISDTSKVTANGGEADYNSYGIYANSAVTISGTSNVTANGGEAVYNSYGIHANSGNVTISGGTVTAAGGTSQNSYGISSYYKAAISGGHVIARAPAGGKALDYDPDLSGYNGYYWRTSTEAPFTASTETPYTHDPAPTYAEFSDGYTYTITLNPNYAGGKPSTVFTGADGKLSELPTLTRKDSVFVGWSTAANGGEAVDLAKVYDRDTTLYAVWGINYGVTVNGVKVTSLNKDNVLGNDKVKYVPATKTLSVENFVAGDLTVAGDGETIVNISDNLGVPAVGTLTVTDAKDVTVTANSGAPAISSKANITCTGNVTITNSKSMAVVGALTVTGAQNVNVEGYGGQAIGGTTDITCTGNVTITNSKGMAVSAPLTVKSAKDVMITANTRTAPAIAGTADITCTGKVEITNSTGIAVNSGLTVKNANDVIVTANTENTKNIDYPAIGGTTDITCTGKVEITNKSGMAVSGGLTVKSAKDVIVTANTENTEDTDYPAIGGNVDITCSGDVKITNKAGMAVSGALTVKNAKDVTVTANTASPAIAGAADITCSGDVTISNTGGGKAVQGTLTYKNAGGDHSYTVKTGASLDKLTTVDAEAAGDVTYGPKSLDASAVKISVGHTADEWKSSSTQHWQVCTACGIELERADHTFSGNTCTVCGYTKSSGGGSGGGSSTPTYTPSVTQPENGTVTVSPKAPKKGDTVTITPKPEDGYTVEQILVTDKNGDPVEVINNGDGTYSFTQPAGKVNVEATFMEDNSMLNFFVDVPADAYYYDAVLWAAENGITGGVDDTHFAPNAPCTRAQIVTFLWRAAGSPEPENVSSFADVSADSYYAKAVAWAVEQGITTGTGDGKFSPNAPCTRAQSVTFLWRAQKSPTSDSVNPFADVAADAYYNNAVLWAAENGITGGTSATTFSPNNDCTRAQIVTFLFRCLGEE